MSTPPKSPSMSSVELSSQPPKVPTKKGKLTASGSAKQSQGSLAEGRTMVLEVVGSDPEASIEEVTKASPLQVGTPVAPFSSSIMTMGNIGTARPLRDPWYQMKGLFPAVPPATSMTVSSMYWVSREFFGSVEEAWIPDPKGIVDLQIKRGVLEPVLQEAGVFEAIVISRGLNMYCDVIGIRYLVRRWCPTTHTFFLAWGEFTVTIEDVANLLILPILGDVDPIRLRLTAAESVIEEELIEGFGGKSASFGGHLAKHSTWVITFRRKSDESEKLAIKISSGNCFPLAPMFLGHLYTHLDLFHADELVGASCRVVASVINMSLLQACLGEHLNKYKSKCRKLKDVAAKFEKMSSIIADKCVGLRQGFPIIFKWSGAKGLAGLMDSLDKGTGFTWRPYSNLGSGFASRSPLLLMHSLAIGVSGLREGDMTRISYLASIKAGWLPAWSPQWIKYVAYCTHRVARQFGFDQDIPGSNLEVLGPDHHMDPYLKDKTYAFYSSMMPQGGTPSDIPIPGLRVEPPSNFRILRNVASGNGYGSRQRAGYVESHEKKSKKGKRVAKESHVAPIDPSKEGKKKARVHVAPTTHFPITFIDVLATSEPVSPSTIVTRGSARRTHSQSKLVTAPVGNDEKGSKDLPIDLSAGSPSGGKEISTKAVKAFVEDVDATMDVGNTLAEEGVHVNATAREFSTLNESNINICEPEGLADPTRGGLIDLGIDLKGDNGVETAGAQTELAPMAEVPFSIPCDLSCVGLPMTRDKLIEHAIPASEGGPRGGMLYQDAKDPYDDVDENLVVREVPAPFSGEMVDTSSSYGDDVEFSPARGDDLDLTLRVPYSRLREGSMRTMAGKGTSTNLPLAAGRVGLSEWSTISAAEGLTQFLEDSTKEIYNVHSPRHFWGKLQDWRGVAKELINLGFVVGFLLERIREVARMYFGRKASAEAEAIDAQIAYYKEQIVQLEAKKNGLPPVVPLGNLSADCVLAHGLID
uniref:Aminotransferase-like plant mobile domain-containing protein n=1 Tax=Fagus sylvatica TaxID=28930 RepID=A0A2N9FUN5_FAGSY